MRFVPHRILPSLHRIANGRTAQSLILYGLRGVGKTVLLSRMRLDAEREGYVPVSIEAPEDRSLPAILGPALRGTLIRMSRGEAAKKALTKALDALASFARSAKLKYEDVEFNVDFEALAGFADSGDLDTDLTDLLQTVGDTESERGTTVILFIDELQYVPEEQLAALISALHAVNQRQLPMTLVGAGLPQLLGQMGRAKSYAERLFEFILIGPLEPEAANQALCVPTEHEGVRFEEAAVDEIVTRTEIAGF